MDLIHRPEHTDMEEDDLISAEVDFTTTSRTIEYENMQFSITEPSIPQKKESIKIEHVKLGRNSTAGTSGLF
jgi:hypothetical protein